MYVVKEFVHVLMLLILEKFTRGIGASNLTKVLLDVLKNLEELSL